MATRKAPLSLTLPQSTLPQAQDGEPQEAAPAPKRQTPKIRPRPGKEPRTEQKTLKHARALRKQQTDAEIKLWSLLRRGQIDGCHFQKRIAIGTVIADFACLEKRLIIEIDGGPHAWREDPTTERPQQFEAQGYQTLRFQNTEILHHPESVILRIRDALTRTSDDHAEAH